jgi:hypothetical protein
MKYIYAFILAITLLSSNVMAMGRFPLERFIHETYSAPNHEPQIRWVWENEMIAMTKLKLREYINDTYRAPETKPVMTRIWIRIYC